MYNSIIISYVTYVFIHFYYIVIMLSQKIEINVLKWIGVTTRLSLFHKVWKVPSSVRLLERFGMFRFDIIEL